MNTFHICWKELRGYFASWIAWAILAGWLLVAGIVFSLVLAGATKGAPFGLAPVFQYLVIVLLFVAPILTMRLIAEERSSGTLEMLFTSPVTEWQVAIGKWLGAWAFCLIMLAFTLYMPAVALKYGSIDFGPVWGAYLALACLGATFCAWGALCSSLSESQVVAGFLCFGGLLFSWMLAAPAGVLPDNVWAQTAAKFSVVSHFGRMMAGAIDTADLVFFASLTFLFLFMTTRVLESRKWR